MIRVLGCCITRSPYPSGPAGHVFSRSSTPGMMSSSMLRMCLCLAILAAAVAEKPWFCHELDCPEFTLVKNHTDMGVEHRRYDAGKWASTVVTGVKYDKAVATGFWRLFKYISGDNEQEQKVEMTAPVTVRVTPSQGPFCEDNFTISFFVPFAVQAAPPTPSDETVFIEQRAPLDVYVKGFGGWAVGKSYLQAAADLTQALTNADIAIDTDHFYTAGYDSPFRLRNRHNEVWILAAAAPSAQHGTAHRKQQQQKGSWLQQVLNRRVGVAAA